MLDASATSPGHGKGSTQEASSASDAAIDPVIVQRAAEWMARLWADDASDADRAAFARWRAEHPQHELAWNRLQAFEHKLLHSVPREVARHALREPAPAAWQGRRRALGLLGLFVSIGGAGYLVRRSESWQIATAGHSTGTGEIRELTLPDGSHVVLASASAIDLHFDADQRLLILRAGEILVATAPDPSPVHRPFRVHSRHGSVQALGTRFTVRQDNDGVHVAVFEGAVEIRPAHAPATLARIDSGHSASFSAEHIQPAVAVPQTADAWTRGMLVADGMRLDELVAELARYRPGVLRCDPAVAHLKVTGVFSLRDTDRALENLTLGLPLEVVWRTRWWGTVKAAG